MSDEMAVFQREMDVWIAQARLHAETQFADALARCESPIERRLLPYLCFIGTPHLVERLNHALDWQERHELFVQHQIGDYRVDFALVVKEFGMYGSPLRFVIECDGADFHDRDNDQRARDSRRDDYLQSQGWHVIRFWGTEIHADPKGCAERAADIIGEQFKKRIVAKTEDDRSGFRQSSENQLTD